MSSLLATAAALAGRFTGVAATVGTETRTLDSASVMHLLPNEIARGPVLLVFPPTGVLDVGVSQLRHDVHEFPVRLLLDPLDVPTRTAWLYAWYDALRDRVEMDTDLGLAYVAAAQPVASRVELDGERYALTPFDVVELIVRVQFYETVTTVLP